MQDGVAVQLIQQHDHNNHIEQHLWKFKKNDWFIYFLNEFNTYVTKSAV
jgi:hypothetical protein